MGFFTKLKKGILAVTTGMALLSGGTSYATPAFLKPIPKAARVDPLENFLGKFNEDIKNETEKSTKRFHLAPTISKLELKVLQKRDYDIAPNLSRNDQEDLNSMLGITAYDALCSTLFSYPGIRRIRNKLNFLTLPISLEKNNEKYGLRIRNFDEDENDIRNYDEEFMTSTKSDGAIISTRFGIDTQREEESKEEAFFGNSVGSLTPYLNIQFRRLIFADDLFIRSYVMNGAWLAKFKKIINQNQFIIWSADSEISRYMPETFRIEYVSVGRNKTLRNSAAYSYNIKNNEHIVSVGIQFIRW
ncbi:hypothetical protein COT47_06335 [Candidatus Woesearchaeota archaeon CG08_land_8_20_14_0_20_43_7]|nr:MAG: hypothetical protein COT47_06335 [Candidatus Woesearchaeota archaeon CG08_land_8_20_14_0_20_43_7]